MAEGSRRRIQVHLPSGRKFLQIARDGDRVADLAWAIATKASVLYNEGPPVVRSLRDQYGYDIDPDDFILEVFDDRDRCYVQSRSIQNGRPSPLVPLQPPKRPRHAISDGNGRHVVESALDPVTRPTTDLSSSIAARITAEPSVDETNRADAAISSAVLIERSSDGINGENGSNRAADGATIRNEPDADPAPIKAIEQAPMDAAQPTATAQAAPPHQESNDGSSSSDESCLVSSSSDNNEEESTSVQDAKATKGDAALEKANDAAIDNVPAPDRVPSSASDWSSSDDEQEQVDKTEDCEQSAESDAESSVVSSSSDDDDDGDEQNEVVQNTLQKAPAEASVKDDDDDDVPSVASSSNDDGDEQSEVGKDTPPNIALAEEEDDVISSVVLSSDEDEVEEANQKTEADTTKASSLSNENNAADEFEVAKEQSKTPTEKSKVADDIESSVVSSSDDDDESSVVSSSSDSEAASAPVEFTKFREVVSSKRQPELLTSLATGRQRQALKHSATKTAASQAVSSSSSSSSSSASAIKTISNAKTTTRSRNKAFLSLADDTPAPKHAVQSMPQRTSRLRTPRSEAQSKSMTGLQASFDNASVLASATKKARKSR